MCGICGTVRFDGRAPDESVLKRMNSVLYHRGPDEEGYYISGKIPLLSPFNKGGRRGINVGLAMRRLSIIDLAGGSQPVYNEKKTVAVVLNGEIYNFLELRKDLEKRHSFYTKTDTEVIAHLWEEHGPGCLKYLRGMFALAVWDMDKERLFVARDRLGKKPLYFTRIRGNFYFSSEMKSFLEVPGFQKEINMKAVHYYLTYQYIPPPMTIWKGVTSLMPAQSLLLNTDGGIHLETYWSLDYREKTDLSFGDAKKKIKDILRESVKLRMISDVPLGAFLSGGIDSSIVVGLMSEASSSPVRTFTIGFEEKEFSEVRFARRVASHFGTDHRELIVKPDYAEILPKIVWHYDQPYADSSALPSYYVAKMTREHVKVALNGDGGDENFAGYLRYKALKASQTVAPVFGLVPQKLINLFLEKGPLKHSADSKRMARYIHRFIQPLKNPPWKRNLIWHAYFTNELKDFVYSRRMKEMFSEDDAYSYLENKFLSAPALDTIDRALYADVTGYLPGCLLVKMDIATMANSLEARSPFLDQEFVKFTSFLPSDWKLKGLKSKYILKEAFKDFLPPGIMTRRKQGFGIPLGKWFRGALRGFLFETLFSSAALKRGYFDERRLRRFVDDHMDGRADYGYCLWALLMLELWHRVFIDGDVKI